MKKRIAFVLVGILVCVGAAIWLVPDTPMPNMDGFWNVRIWRVNGADMTELTEQVDQTALRETLTQVQAKRVPRSQRSVSILSQIIPPITRLDFFWLSVYASSSDSTFLYSLIVNIYPYPPASGVCVIFSAYYFYFTIKSAIIPL